MKSRSITVASDTERQTERLLEQRTAEFRDYARQQQEAQQQQAQSIAAANIAIARIQQPDMFNRYGAEIDTALQQFPQAAQSPQGMQMLVDVVKSRHLDELVHERMQQREAQRTQDLATATAMPRSMAAPMAPPLSSNVLDRITTPNYKATLDRLQLTQKTVDEFLAATYMKHDGLTKEQAEEKWIAQVNRGDVITDGKEMISPLFGYDHNPPRR